jgi:hypothetical protein
MLRARGETLDVTDQVSLIVQFKDNYGNPADTDALPTISIVQPSGNVLFTPTTAGVSKIGTGKYNYIFTIPLTGPYGVYQDNWFGTINGVYVQASFSFVVVKTDTPAINLDGYYHLGDIYPLNYSQTAIQNINKLLRVLKARLNSSGKTKRDINGEAAYIDCDIFSIDTLVTMLGSSISDFNQIPYFTSYTFDDTDFIQHFLEVLVEGAVIYALASQALIERGREFQFTDNSINFNPPSMAEILNSQASSLLTLHLEKLKLIKNSMRSAPLGLGRYGMTDGISPAINRLRHRRAGKII